MFLFHFCSIIVLLLLLNNSMSNELNSTQSLNTFTHNLQYQQVNFERISNNQKIYENKIQRFYHEKSDRQNIPLLKFQKTNSQENNKKIVYNNKHQIFDNIKEKIIKSLIDVVEQIKIYINVFENFQSRQNVTNQKIYQNNQNNSLKKPINLTNLQQIVKPKKIYNILQQSLKQTKSKINQFWLSSFEFDKITKQQHRILQQQSSLISNKIKNCPNNFQFDDNFIYNQCKVGFYKKNNIDCQPKTIFYLLNLYMGFIFMLMPGLLMQNLINQFSILDYNQQQLQKLNYYVKYLGNVNRQKFAIFFIRNILSSEYNQLKFKQLDLIPEYYYEITDKQFLQNQQLPIYFTSNTLFIFTFSLIFIICIYTIIKIMDLIYTKFINTKNVNKKLVFKFIFVSFLNLSSQYICFIFWRQIVSISSFLQIKDKLNVIFCVLCGFLLILLLFIGNKFIKCVFMSQQIQQKQQNQNILQIISNLLIGIGRYIILGSIQSIKGYQIIKIALLLILNLSILIYYHKYNDSNLKIVGYNKKIFRLGLIGFYFCKLLNKIYSVKKLLNYIQLLIVYFVIILAFIEIISVITQNVIKFCYYLFKCNNQTTSLITKIYINQKGNKFNLKIKQNFLQKPKLKSKPKTQFFNNQLNFKQQINF